MSASIVPVTVGETNQSNSMKKSQVKFNTKAVSERIFNALVPVQTERLIAYAKERIGLIASQIMSYDGGHHMQRTMNLLDSLCWGVQYNGHLEGSGFYGEQQATSVSHLHEWSKDFDAFPVGGRVLAENFVKQMGNLKSKGWRVFFAVLAPYWGYWEKGFRIKTKSLSDYDDDEVRAHSRFMKFAVMTEQYDTISNDLKPSVMKFSVNAPDPSPTSIAKRAKSDRDRGTYSKLEQKYRKRYDYS